MTRGSLSRQDNINDRGFPGRKYQHWIFFFLAVGMAVTVGIAIFADIGKIFKTGGFNFIYLPVLLLLAPLNYCLRYLKWKYLLWQLDISVPEKLNIKIFTAGLAMTLTPGKLGELLKCYLLAVTRGVPVSVSAPVVMTERLTDGISMLLLAAIGSLYYGYGGKIIAVTAAAIFLFVYSIQNKKLAAFFLNVVRKIPGTAGFIVSLKKLYESSYLLLQPKSLLVSVLLGVVSWGLEGVVLFLAVLALGSEMTVLHSLFIVSFSAIIGAISFMPGGLLAAEGSILGLMLLAGYGREIAGAATIITRFSTLWLGAAFGIVGLFVMGRYLQKDN